MHAGPLLHSSIVTFIVVVYLFSKSLWKKEHTLSLMDVIDWEHEAYFMQWQFKHKQHKI